MTKPPTIIKADPDGMTADELKAVIEANPKPLLIDEAVYDPVQEIVKGLNRIASTLEEQTAMAREEYRSKGFVIPPKKN